VETTENYDVTFIDR